MLILLPAHLITRTVGAWLLLSSCLPGRAQGQQLPSAFGRYQLDVWRAQDGVRLAFTSNLVQTRDGYLWLSSQSGLTRFDGFRFRVFDNANTPALRGRPNLQTYPLVEDANGVLWVGTDVGLLTFAGGTIRPAAMDSSFATDLVHAATVDPSGVLWAVTRSGRVVRVPRDGGLHAVAGTVVRYSGAGIAADAAGDVWIALGPNALYRVHNDSLSPVTLPPEAGRDGASRVRATPDGSVWLGTPTAILQWRGGQIRRIPVPGAEGAGGISCFAVGPDGTLWIGTHGAGLRRYDGRRFTSFGRRDGLSDDRVVDILVDRSQNVWVATRDGLNRLRAFPFDSYTEKIGLPTEFPGAMIRDSFGRIWLAPPTGGLYNGRIEAGRARFDQVEPVSHASRILALTNGEHGSIWAGKLDGSVTRWSAGALRGSRIADGLPPVTDLLENRDGTLWIGTWNGLLRLRHGDRRRFTVEDGLPDNNVHRLFRDSHGTVWVATQTGVARATDDGERFTAQVLPAGSAKRALVLFEAPQGTVWLGSADGLARVAGGRGALVTAAHGLPENWTGAIEMEGSEHLLLGQLGGLARVAVVDLVAVADGQRTALTTVASHQLLDGLPGGDPISWPHPWSFRDPSGKLWFAVSRGIIVVDPTHAAPTVRPPAMHIEETLVDGVSVAAETSITLGPSVRRLEVRYTGVDLTNGSEVRFRYRLDGFDTTWADAGSQRTASYTRLAAGRYRFRVVGRTPGSGWGPTEAALDVRVLPPLYLRGWFIALSALTFALLLFGAHRAVLRARIDAMEKERSRLAREIHDSLLQGFGGIALQLHAASARLALPPTQRPLLDGVLALIDRTLTEARDLVWDIRTPDEPRTDLFAACEEAARRIFADTATKLRVLFRGRRRQLPSEIRTESLRIVEEALTNARKHADASNVWVELEYGFRRLRLTIRDDGRGFDIGNEGTSLGHWGLLGMRERASQIGAKVAINSQPGSGTVVSIVVPLRSYIFARLMRRQD